MASKAKGNLEVKNPELLKPLVFSKRPKVFKFITFLVSAGVCYYCIFSHDWGEKRHCFSWIRDFTESSKKRLFSISPVDSNVSLDKQKRQSHQHTKA